VTGAKGVGGETVVGSVMGVEPALLLSEAG
jgi:hypothetical protein